MNWKQRNAFIARIGTLEINFVPTARKEAIEKGLHMKDGDGYRYCEDPATITDRQLKQINADVDLYIQKARRIEALQHDLFRKIHPPAKMKAAR